MITGQVDLNRFKEQLEAHATKLSRCMATDPTGLLHCTRRRKHVPPREHECAILDTDHVYLWVSPYDRPAAGTYVRIVTHHEMLDHLWTVEAYLNDVREGALIDYDGYGYPVKGGCIDTNRQLIPSEYDDNLPLDSTHVVWYNR